MADMSDDYRAPSRDSKKTHQRGRDKLSRIPVKVQPTTELPRKPEWIRARAPQGPGVTRIRKILREHKLSSVCEEAQCPNLGECFTHGTATFMIMGDICTRRCPFCDAPWPPRTPGRGRAPATGAGHPGNGPQVCGGNFRGQG